MELNAVKVSQYLACFRRFFVKWAMWLKALNKNMAEEVGVEPTRRFVSTSLVLKTRHPTGDVALPSFYRLSRLRIALGFAIVR
jgi:hypothetical protein